MQRYSRMPCGRNLCKACRLLPCFRVQNKRAVALSLVWQPFVTPGRKGICSGMRCVRLRSDFHEFLKAGTADFHVVQSSRRFLLLEILKIILLVRRQRLPEHIPCGRASERHPIYLRQVIKRIVTMNSVHYRGILKCMKVLWGAA